MAQSNESFISQFYVCERWQRAEKCQTCVTSDPFLAQKREGEWQVTTIKNTFRSEKKKKFIA